QRSAQVMGLLGDLAVELLELHQLLHQRRLLLGFPVVDVLDLAAALIDLFTEGFEQCVQRLLAGLADGLTLGLDDAACQLFELPLLPPATLPQQRLLFVNVPLAVLQTALQGGMIHPQLFMVTLPRLQARLPRLVFLRQLLTLALLFTAERAQALAAPLPFLAAPLAVLTPLPQPL